MEKEKAKGLKLSDKSADIVCKLISDMLEKAGNAEWKKPWLDAGRKSVMNLKHKKPYRGFNAFLLEWACFSKGWKTPFFLTLDQIGQMGLKINKVEDEDGKIVSEEYIPVFKWLPRHYNVETGEKVTDAELAEMTDDEREKVLTRFSLRVFAEWNIDQTNMKELHPLVYEKYVAVASGMEKVVHDANVADEVLDYILTTQGAWRCPIKHSAEPSAYYTPGGDFIHLPEKEMFYKANDYYSTALHEMAHSTKKIPSMSRDYGRKSWGDEGYATEELVAELTSAIVSHDIGLERTIDEQHIAYVKSWKKAIADKDVLVRIIDDIMRCVTYELNHYNKVSALLASKSLKNVV